MNEEKKFKFNLFQVVVVVLGVLFLILYYKNQDIGRYQMTHFARSVNVIDTKTGRYYLLFVGESPVGLDFDSMYVKATNNWKKDK